MQSDLSPLLKPESVAIVGVSKNPARIGGRLFRYLTRHGYEGRLALVNPKYEQLNGIDCYPSIADIPFKTDCALIAVPGKHVVPVLNECAQKGVGAAVIFSSGFAEMGVDGRNAQDRIGVLADESNMHICGPNCIGLINFHQKTALSFSQLLETDSLIPGNIGFVSQSGALGGSMVNRAQDSNIGLSYFISSGNEASLEVSDYIRHLVLHDDQTEVIAAVVEGFKDGAKFVQAAELALKHGKPLIVLKTGTTDVGQKAAASHTGSLTGSDAVIDAVFRQKGVTRVHHYDQLLQTASLFSKGSRPKGNRVGILTSSGGAGIIMADYYTKMGLQIPEPSPETRTLAAKEIGSFGKVDNPFDLTGQIFSDPQMFSRCMRLFVEEDRFDIIQVNVSMVAGQSSEQRGKMLLESIEGCPKPVVSWWAAGGLSDPGIRVLEGSPVVAFRSPERCAEALQALVEYSRHAERGQGADAKCRTQSDPKHLEEAAQLLNTGETSLSEHESKTLLKLYGIPVTRDKIVRSVDDAVQFAGQIGYPVALKIDSPDILHKTEADVIRLGIGSKEDLVKSYGEIMDAATRYDPGARINGVAVQEMVTGGTEVITGMSQDQQFGPTIAFGLGGIFVEVLKDISLRVTPLSKSDAQNMVREIKGYPILKGIRGKAPADIDAVIDLLQKLSRLVEDFKEDIAEIDINPLLVFDEGQGVKALDALVVLKNKSKE
jgi:acyl-CoA synthetase (NDP forming)